MNVTTLSDDIVMRILGPFLITVAFALLSGVTYAYFVFVFPLLFVPFGPAVGPMLLALPMFDSSRAWLLHCSISSPSVSACGSCSIYASIISCAL